MDCIWDKANDERYDRMIERREAEIEATKKQLEELQNIAEMLRQCQITLKKDIRLLDGSPSEDKLAQKFRWTQRLHSRCRIFSLCTWSDADEKKSPAG